MPANSIVNQGLGVLAIGVAVDADLAEGFSRSPVVAADALQVSVLRLSNNSGQSRRRSGCQSVDVGGALCTLLEAEDLAFLRW